MSERRADAGGSVGPHGDPHALEARLAWIRRNMPLTAEEIRAMPRLDGVRLACSLHLEPKVVPALEGLRSRGASLFLIACNPATVRDEVVGRLRDQGAQTFAWEGMSAGDAAEAQRRALAWEPSHLWETGADLSAALAGPGSPGVPNGVAAAMECTGSGIARLRQLASSGRTPPYPVFDCDAVPIKEGLHNRYLVGLSAWHTFTERTQLSLHGKRVLVVGYGLVGRGVALTARAIGGAVSVAERDPARALEARYDGFPAGSLEELAGSADVLVTATGASRVVTAPHLRLLPSGCILLNVGHGNDEIEVEALGPLREVIPCVEEARVGEATLFLFAHGAMSNLAAGQGDALNTFDLTMAAMLAGLRFTLSDEARAFPPGLNPLPRSAWEETARRAAAS